MRKHKGKRLAMAVIIVFLLLASLPAQAATINFTQTVGGQAQDVTINYTFSANTLTLSLTNNLADPPSVMGGVSQLNFTVLGGLVGTLSSVTGTMIDVASDGTFVVVLGNPDWYQSGPGFLTTALGSSGPDDVLIGQPGPGGVYTGNASILGNGPHNPFAQGSVQLVYNIPGATVDTTLTYVALGFGTQPVVATVPPPNDEGVPEPGTFAVIGASLFALGAHWRLRRPTRNS